MQHSKVSLPKDASETMISAGDEQNAGSELIAGKYRLVRIVGQGGMGSVWEGEHTTLGTRVAIKFIEPEFLDNPEARNRFENEARAAAALRSRHVVQVFDHGLTRDGRPYIVMEFLSGEPLDQRLERMGRLTPLETTRILFQVCRALSRAHQAGIVHRDLKPENIFLVSDIEEGSDIAKVVDFGIAKFADTSPLTSATRTGSVLGSPYYMSPEQARGLRSVDYRSDLWSIGVIAYQCLTGHLPFQGESVGDLLVTLCTSPLPIPSEQAPDLPPSFDAWFARALSRQPEMRFSSAIEAAEALCESLGISTHTESWGSSSGYRMSGMATPTWPPATVSKGAPVKASWIRSSQWPLLGGAAAIAGALASLAYFAAAQLEPSAPPLPAATPPREAFAALAPAAPQPLEATTPVAVQVPTILPVEPSALPPAQSARPAAPPIVGLRSASAVPARRTGRRTTALASAPAPVPAGTPVEAKPLDQPAPSKTPSSHEVDIDKSDPWRQ